MLAMLVATLPIVALTSLPTPDHATSSAICQDCMPAVACVRPYRTCLPCCCTWHAETEGGSHEWYDPTTAPQGTCGKHPFHPTPPLPLPPSPTPVTPTTPLDPPPPLLPPPAPLPPGEPGHQIPDGCYQSVSNVCDAHRLACHVMLTIQGGSANLGFKAMSIENGPRDTCSVQAPFSISYAGANEAILQPWAAPTATGDPGLPCDAMVPPNVPYNPTKVRRWKYTVKPNTQCEWFCVPGFSGHELHLDSQGDFFGEFYYGCECFSYALHYLGICVGPVLALTAAGGALLALGGCIGLCYCSCVRKRHRALQGAPTQPFLRTGESDSHAPCATPPVAASINAS